MDELKITVNIFFQMVATFCYVSYKPNTNWA